MKQAIGGQAVIEGVMMKSPTHYSIVVRNHKGKLVSNTEKLKKKAKWTTWIFIRGFVNLLEMLIIGMKAITWSADQAEEDNITKTEFGFTIFFSVLIALALFIAAPFFLTKFLVGDKGFLFNLVDGIIRILILLGYFLVISRFKDIKRLFAFHGAEHCAVNCYENDEKLTVKNVKKYSTIHARCGTSFVVIVVFVSIIVFSILPRSSLLIRLGGRLVLLPVIAGISYEMLKLSSKFKDHKLISFLMWPGLIVQKITTNIPDDSQIQIAIMCLKNVLEKK